MKATQNGSRGRPDFLLLILTLLLVGFGLVMVFSASSGVAKVSYDDSLYFIKRQFIWAGLGTFMMLFMMNLRYQVFKKSFMLLFIPVIILLMIVPFSQSVNGARSWFNIGSVGIQPTEAAKLALILYLGALISKKDEKFRDFKKGLLPVIVIVGFICMLIMLQPDLGSCLVIASCAGIMILAGGANLKHIFLSGTVIAVLGAVIVSIWMAIKPKSWQYRIDRFTAFTDPLADPLGSGWQMVASLQALGHGGLTGAGFGESVQKLHYLKYAYNDFIFSIIGEEFGFIGSTLFLLFYLLFLWRGLIVALRCPDQYGTIVGVGIVGLFAIQAFINIGGVTKAIPMTGVTLPFISYGGSSLLICLMCMGVLLSVSRESNKADSKSTSTGNNRRVPSTTKRTSSL
ncbi:cell division protein FtsW [Paenibacillus endophyticus]|uniref:Probable peptidoglycan glycosyltransferase FtsW n=1 Tax=Paenibacillus endophyticus TaxID=1294268 RepID=A0A7W5G9Z9_9BACL|nr:putative lipid II flippase FtsW [Paenibacillus endophyticus]MBB3152245.1 cell division protein FtsW [Paenibacillus endophyticus]